MERDIEMMEQPIRWPLYPYLPVKRHLPKGGWPELGVLVADLAPPTVFFVNIGSLPLPPEEFANLKKIEYPSFHRMAVDGWVVD